jgi:hypothetical protein
MAIIAFIASLFFYYFDSPSIILPSPLSLDKILYYIYNNLFTFGAITIIKVLTINPAYKYIIISFYSYIILLYIIRAPIIQSEGIVKNKGLIKEEEVY